MKKPLSIALAAAIAVSAVGMAATPAAAHDRHNDAAAIAIFGAIAGMAAIAAASQHHHDRDYYYYGGYPPPPPRYYGGYYGGYHRGYDPHVAWCFDHYRTYNPATNTYFRRPGVPAVCYSPYD